MIEITEKIREMGSELNKNLETYITTFLRLSGLKIEDINLCHETRYEENSVVTMYWCEEKTVTQKRPVIGEFTD